MKREDILTCIKSNTQFPVTGSDAQSFSQSLNEIIVILNKLLSDGIIHHTIYCSECKIPQNSILDVGDFKIC